MAIDPVGVLQFDYVKITAMRMKRYLEYRATKGEPNTTHSNQL